MKINEIQRSLGLSSPSVAQYHVKKLLQFGLIREVPEGYLVENVVFENLIRFRRVSIPIQTGYAGFFLGALAVLLTVFRPLNLTSLYYFALFVIIVGAAVSLYETLKVASRFYWA